MKWFLLLIPFALNPCSLFSDLSQPDPSTQQSSTEKPLKLLLAYPRAGAKIPAVKNSFVFGAVSPPNATVSVNGSTVSVYKTGSYLTMIPFNPGEFKIRVQAQLNDQMVETIRTVFVSSPAIPLPSEPLAISTESVQPTTNITVAGGGAFYRFISKDRRTVRRNTGSEISRIVNGKTSGNR